MGRRLAKLSAMLRAARAVGEVRVAARVARSVRGDDALGDGSAAAGVAV